MLAVFDKPAGAAGVLTKSSTAGAPVRWCRKHLANGKARALIVNSGNANVYTGKAGDDAVKAAAKGVAELVNCRPGDVFVASTGVIGETLPIDKVVKALPKLHGKLGAKLAPGRWHDAAVAIMTTDTFPKGASIATEIGGVPVTITGIAKGSGMIAPDMATMLAYVFTDAKIPADVLQALLKSAADKSFNSIMKLMERMLEEAEDDNNEEEPLSKTDVQILEAYNAKLLAKHGISLEKQPPGQIRARNRERPVRSAPETIAELKSKRKSNK